MKVQELAGPEPVPHRGHPCEGCLVWVGAAPRTAVRCPNLGRRVMVEGCREYRAAPGLLARCCFMEGRPRPDRRHPDTGVWESEFDSQTVGRGGRATLGAPDRTWRPVCNACGADREDLVRWERRWAFSPADSAWVPLPKEAWGTWRKNPERYRRKEVRWLCPACSEEAREQAERDGWVRRP